MTRLLADLVWPEDAYARATNLDLDYRDPERVPEYKFSSKSLRLLEDVLDGCQGQRKERAWSIVGPYGSGKSTFGLFMLQLLTGHDSPWFQGCMTQLQIIDPLTGQRAEFEIKSKGIRYLPVIVQGSRIPLDLALCRALHKLATDPTIDTSWVPAKFATSLTLTLQSLEAGISDSPRVVELYEQASDLARIAGYHGLLVVVDEFGKFLERSAWQGDLPDLSIAQYLAELASGLSEPQILFAVLLHQGFHHYASSLTQREWLEWAKIQGRFRQVDFNEAPDNVYDLIAGSINQREPSQHIQHVIDGWAERKWERVRHLRAFNIEPSSARWTALLPRVYPFHPLALYALPRLSSRLGQNERTVFTFLASNDPLGFKRFLSGTSSDSGELPSLTLDYLFDYFLSGSKYGLLPPDVQRSVSEIEAALDRLGDRPPLEVKLLKTLGCLSLIGTDPSLPASEEVIAIALDAETAEARHAVHEALQNLAKRKIVVYRRFSGEYHVWQGSDFDFEDALGRAREEIQGDFDLSSILTQELDLRPLIAHRHSFETGTMRYFSVHCLSAEEALGRDSRELVNFIADSPADGAVFYLFPRTRRELVELKNWVQNISDPRVIAVIPKEPVGVATIAQDLASLRRVWNIWPELGDDPVALKELSGRIDAIADLLRNNAESVTEPAAEAGYWYWKGEGRHVADQRELNVLLSAICDEVYFASPIIRNELINRRSPSQPAIVASKKIISGLLAAEGNAGLGFLGNGPEVSIFRAIFETTGIYCESEEGNYALCVPTSNGDVRLRSVWVEIEDFLRACDESGKSLTPVYRTLGAPPYGIRRGLIPLLIWIVLIFNRNRLCLYENGTFIREWSAEIFERFVKSPDSFALRWLVLSGPVGDLLHKLNRSIPDAPTLTDCEDGVPLSRLLENLYHWYHQLPDCAKHTLRISPHAQEFRRALSTSVDPIDLLLSRLPEGLGLDSVSNKDDITSSRAPDTLWSSYESAFGEVVEELSTAYAVLCNEVIALMASKFGTLPLIKDLRSFFHGLQPVIIDHVRESTAKAFIVRAQSTEASDLHWLESLGAGLANQAPRFWMDHHFEEFDDKVSLVALALSDARRRAYAHQDGGKKMSRVIVEQPDGQQVEAFFTVDEVANELGDAAKATIGFLEEVFPDTSTSYRQRVLASALELMSRNTPEGRQADVE